MTIRNIALTLFLALATALGATAKPRIRIIATGGTIAGVSASATSSAYNAGQVGVEALLKAVPQVSELADVSGEQQVNIP